MHIKLILSALTIILMFVLIIAPFPQKMTLKIVFELVLFILFLYESVGIIKIWLEQKKKK